MKKRSWKLQVKWTIKDVVMRFPKSLIIESIKYSTYNVSAVKEFPKSFCM